MKRFRDRFEIKKEEIYRKIIEMKERITTSQPSIDNIEFVIKNACERAKKCW